MHLLGEVMNTDQFRSYEHLVVERSYEHSSVEMS